MNKHSPDVKHPVKQRSTHGLEPSIAAWKAGFGLLRNCAGAEAILPTLTSEAL